MEQTIFDKILRREISADIVYESEYSLAFRDINPIAPAHILVIPKKRMARIANLADVDPMYAGMFMRDIAIVAKQMGLEDNGYRVVFNSGAFGQQTVEYLHAHIIGGRKMHWPPG